VYLSLLDGTPRSYAFMLAGYTVALIGFPSVSSPETVFDTAAARVQEVSLGIVCASLVSMLVLPRSVGSALTDRADAWLADARRLGHDVLVGGGTEQERQVGRMRLTVDAAEMKTLAIHLGYESAADAHLVRGLARLSAPMAARVTLLASASRTGCSRCAPAAGRCLPGSPGSAASSSRLGRA
jgi:uncharacterized membrane protein YccC